MPIILSGAKSVKLDVCWSYENKFELESGFDTALMNLSELEPKSVPKIDQKEIVEPSISSTAIYLKNC